MKPDENGVRIVHVFKANGTREVHTFQDNKLVHSRTNIRDGRDFDYFEEPGHRN